MKDEVALTAWGDARDVAAHSTNRLIRIKQNSEIKRACTQLKKGSPECFTKIVLKQTELISGLLHESVRVGRGWIFFQSRRQGSL